VSGVVHVQCPLCGGDEPRPLFKAADRLRLSDGEHRLVKCGTCGMVYLDPRPSDDELLACYPKEYWGGREKGIRESVRAFEERLKEGYKLRAVAAAGLTGGRLLDVGCGRGEFISLMAARGFDVAGLEPGEEAARRGRAESGLDIMHGTLDTVGLPPGSFDCVTMWHVLEHLPDPLGALGRAGRLLAPGGKLVAALPDFGGWQAGRFREDWFGIDAPRHLSHFTRETLTAMMEKAGFCVERFLSCGARYETTMLVRSMFPALNRKKLDALERGRPSKYIYKAAQLLLDAGLMPAGYVLTASGRGATFIVIAPVKVKVGEHDAG